MSKSVEDYILVLENVVSDDLCDAIIKEYNISDDWQKAEVGSGLNTKARNCDIIDISAVQVIDKNKNIRLKIDEKLFECSSKVLKVYKEKFAQIKNIEGDSGYNLLRYKQGGFYVQHLDHHLSTPRIISCSFSLNDDYEGGEWGFFDRNLTLKVKKGSALLFPSNFMYPHEIMPVHSGVRFSIVTWFI